MTGDAARIAELERQLAERDTENARITAELRAATAPRPREAPSRSATLEQLPDQPSGLSSQTLAEVRQLAQPMEALTRTLVQHQEEVSRGLSNFRSITENLNRQVTSLTEQVSSLTQDRERLTTRIGELEGENTRLTAANTGLEQRYTQVLDTLTAVQHDDHDRHPFDLAEDSPHPLQDPPRHASSELGVPIGDDDTFDSGARQPSQRTQDRIEAERERHELYDATPPGEGAPARERRNWHRVIMPLVDKPEIERRTGLHFGTDFTALYKKGMRTAASNSAVVVPPGTPINAELAALLPPDRRATRSPSPDTDPVPLTEPLYLYSNAAQYHTLREKGAVVVYAAHWHQTHGPLGVHPNLANVKSLMYVPAGLDAHQFSMYNQVDLYRGAVMKPAVGRSTTVETEFSLPSEAPPRGNALTQQRDAAGQQAFAGPRGLDGADRGRGRGRGRGNGGRT